MELVYLRELHQRMKKDSVGRIPCSSEEVTQLEEHLKIKLPRAYREFLLTMGKYFGPSCVGTECCYDDLFDLLETAEKILIFNKLPISLPNDAFVFTMHQGYQFGFLRLSEGDDPPIYWYNECKQPFVDFDCIYPTFSFYLSEEVYSNSVWSPIKSKITISR